MFDPDLLKRAMGQLAGNPEQTEAARATTHCVVLAGPGSGKTKTLTTAIARALIEDVTEPRGIACITYNNECALELETRLHRLGIETGKRVFVGTVHGFALSQVIAPYARCVFPELPSGFRVASRSEARHSVEVAYEEAIGEGGDPHNRWRFAETKRRRHVDRTLPIWRERNPELADFIEAFERDLRRRALIDFDDMPLIAFRMIQAHPWIAQSIRAKFPVLFVDEYQDLGYALHELVLRLCLEAGIRLFAVGDPDQSIYGFTDANPELLKSLSRHERVRSISLHFNYRCGVKIINASLAALGEERNYGAPVGTADGIVLFRSIDGSLDVQAKAVAEKFIPAITEEGVTLDEIAVLYRTVEQGNAVALAAQEANLPIVRSDKQALVKRSSRMSRFLENCARWVAGGWKNADPPFRRLSSEAAALVFGDHASSQERDLLQFELATVLRTGIHALPSVNSWLKLVRDQLIYPWRQRARTVTEEWDVIEEMIARTESFSSEGDMMLAQFAGKVEGKGRINLSTLHSSKGREFDAVILFAMNRDVIPSARDQQSGDSMREARRLFYVGVTRARRTIYLVYGKGNHSPWVAELYERVAS